MRRVAIVGGSGSGKSTLAASLAEKIDATSIELDELFHGENRAPTPTPEFRRRVAEALDTGLFVGNLWYTNFSDMSACRTTGMTRFATFWMDGGEIVAPVNVLRWTTCKYL